MKKLALLLMFVLAGAARAETPLPPEVVSLLQSGSVFAGARDMRSLGIKDARIHVASKHRVLQELIDRLTERYLNTPSARRLILIANQAEPLMTELGVSRAMSERLAQEVGNTFPLDPMFQLRSYVFVYTDTPYRFWSWTTTERKTYLFLGPNDLTEERVLDLIVHETGVISDACMLQTIQAESEADIDAFSYAPIRFAMAAMRSFRLESAILSDLGIRSAKLAREIPLPSDESSCVRTLEKIALQSIDLDAVLFRAESRQKATPEALAPYFAQIRGKSGICMKVFRSCNRFFLGSGFNGPRPRVGGD